MVACLPLCVLHGTGASTILISMCPASTILTCPYHSSLFSVIFCVTGATFTDLMCWFLILSFSVTPHIQFSIPISFTSSLCYWLFVVDHVSAPYSYAGLIAVLYICPFTFTGNFLSHDTPLHFLYAPYVLYPYSYIRSPPTLPRCTSSCSPFLSIPLHRSNQLR